MESPSPEIPSRTRAIAPGGVAEVLLLAWPAVINMMSITVMGAVDTFFAGKLGTAPQGAVGFCNTLLWVVLCFFVGTLEMVQTFVAQHTGAGSPRRAARWGAVGLHLALAFAVVPTAVAFAGRALFETAGIAPEMIPPADTYFRVRLLGSVVFLLSRVGDSWYRGLGDTRTPMLIAVAGNLVNVVLDAVLVLGWEPLGIPGFGVAGLAWATVAATAVQLGVYVALWRRQIAAGKSAPRLRERAAAAEYRELLRVGAPSGLHWLLDIGAWALFTVAVARLDAVQAAANVIGITIIRASFMPGFGIATAAQTLVGQYLGAHDPRTAARSGWSALRISCVYMGTAGLLFGLFRHELVGLFSNDAEVVRLGARLMIWAALFQIGDGAQLTLSGALRGAGDTRYVMVTGLTGAWAVFAPLTLVLMFGFGLGAEAGWISVNAWVITLTTMLVWRFRGDAWKSGKIRLEPRSEPETDVV